MKIAIKNAGNCIISEHKLNTYKGYLSISEALSDLLTDMDYPLEAGDKIEIVAETENEKGE